MLIVVNVFFVYTFIDIKYYIYILAHSFVYLMLKDEFVALLLQCIYIKYIK